MSHDYMQNYTDIRTGKVSFHQFMEMLGAAYCQGQKTGGTQRQANPAAQQPTGGARVAYEAIF